MYEMEIPEEVNNPEKPSGRLFSEKWRAAWKQLEERARQRPGAVSYISPRYRVRSADYSVPKPSRASRKGLPDIGATRTLSGLRFPAGKKCE
jgi:hypothetical protein